MSEFEYTHPKILAIDLDRTVVASLQDAGLNIEWGTFGSPYQVDSEYRWFPIITNHNLPENLTDNRVIIIDLCQSIGLEKKPCISGEFLYFSEPDLYRTINPRYRSMDIFRMEFDRIYNNGGIFIIFSNERDGIRVQKSQEYKYISQVFIGFIEKIRFKTFDIGYSNWSFLSEINCQNLSINSYSGINIEKIEESFISELFFEYLDEFIYHARIYPERGEMNKKWARLMVALGNATVASVINEISVGKGLILLLPNIPDLNKKSSFLLKLITEYLHKVVPNLCNNLEKKAHENWLTLPKYEIPKIQRVKNKLANILAEHEQRLSKLEIAIAEERKKLSYWHDLITSTDCPLIDAVKKAFHVLGFKQIIDPNNNQEDLQIRDYRPILLLEILGTSENCIDDTKIWRYLAPRMQEYKTFEVKGLIIVNHQKGIPPLERDNENIFSEKVLKKAQEYNLGLITTWEIYRLMKNALKLGWKHEQIQDIFYQTGQINPIASHYQYIGTVEDFDESQNTAQIIIDLEKFELQPGDKIAFDFAVEIEEQKIENIKQNDENRGIIEIGNLTAEISTKLSQEELKHEIRLFKILEE